MSDSEHHHLSMRPRTARDAAIPRLSRGRAHTACQRLDHDGRPRSNGHADALALAAIGSAHRHRLSFPLRLERTAREPQSDAARPRSSTPSTVDACLRALEPIGEEHQHQRPRTARDAAIPRLRRGWRWALRTTYPAMVVAHVNRQSNACTSAAIQACARHTRTRVSAGMATLPSGAARAPRRC